MLFFTSRTGLLSVLLLLGSLLGRAQTWQQALSGNGQQPGPGGTSVAKATVVEATGNVLVTGYFTGSVTFGTSLLTSAGQEDVFVAKWDTTAHAWSWAVGGGGGGHDYGLSLAVSDANVYVTGSFTSNAGTRLAGQALVGAGSEDLFVAKYQDLGEHVAPGWALSGGGTGSDAGQGLAVSGVNVYVTGYFTSNTGALIAGTALPGSGSTDLFVAKYVDQGAGWTTGWVTTGTGYGPEESLGIALNGASVYVTGSFDSSWGLVLAGTSLQGAGGLDLFVARFTDQGASVANAWAVSGGGTGTDVGRAITVAGSSVYITGTFATNTNARIAGVLLNGPDPTSYSPDVFVAKYVDTGTRAGGSWATSGGGAGEDSGQGIAVAGTSIYVTGSFNTTTGPAIFAGQLLTNASAGGLYVASYADQGPSVANRWAVSAGGRGGDEGTGLAVQGAHVYVAALTGRVPASFGPRPGLLAPAASAALGVLTSETGNWQQVAGPLQGGISVALGSAATTSGDVYVTGYFSGTVGFGQVRLTSGGGNDVFLAKWNAPSGQWVWATSGGGPDDEFAYRVAVQGSNVYVVGSFTTSASLAGQALMGAGKEDVFVAKYVDEGPRVRAGWAASGGGTGGDYGLGLAVSGTSVYVTGSFSSGTGAVVAGTSLSGAGDQDLFVAKYVDAGTSFRNGWASSGGGSGYDVGQGIAVTGTRLYVTGAFTSNSDAHVAGTALPGAGSLDVFVAAYTDLETSASPAWARSDGGPSRDSGQDIAVQGTSLYVTGDFYSGTNARFAGMPLAGAGNQDVFIARYTDQGTAVGTNWASSGGGMGEDYSTGIAASGPNVYVTGSFATSTQVTFAGQSLTGAGGDDIFVAKYLDQETTAGNSWATRAGGAFFDIGNAVTVVGNTVYVAGAANPRANFGSLTLSNTPNNLVNFISRLTDATFLPVRSPALLGIKNSCLSLFPNPVPTGTTLRGLPADTPVQILNALGQLATRLSADATGQVQLPSLAPGIYVVRAGLVATRLVVQ